MRTKRRLAEPHCRCDFSVSQSGAEGAPDPYDYGTEPILGEASYAGRSESRNRFTDVAFFVHTFSMLVRHACFERDGDFTNAADNTSWIRGASRACHTWSSLRTTSDYGITGNKSDYLGCNSVTNRSEARKSDSHRELRKLRRFPQPRLACHPGKKFKVCIIRSSPLDAIFCARIIE